MKFSAIFFKVFCGTWLFAQGSFLEDKMIEAMFNELEQKSDEPDSVRMEKMLQKYLKPYFEKWDTIKVDSVAFSILNRIQRDCNGFSEIVERLYPDSVKNNGNKRFDQPQKSTITDKQLDEFKNEKYFYYLINDETTYLILDKGKWFEFFQDNTFSDNLMEWTDRTKFKLTFLESSNLEKKAFSRPGDEYDYEIISREENWYWILSFQDEGSRFYVNFKV